MRSRFAFENLGAFLSFVTVAGVSSYVTFSSKLVVTAAGSILSQSCDLLQYRQLAGGSSRGALGILYPRTVTSLGSFFPSLSQDLAIAATLLVALMLAGAFLFTLTLLKDARAGLLASVVAVFFVSATGVLQLSEYAFLEGLAFALLTAAFLFRYHESQRLWLLPPAALLGMLAAFSDPYWGVILFGAAVGTALLSVVEKVSQRRKSWTAVATAPAFAASAYSLALYHPTPAASFQWDGVLMSILALAALWGGTSLFLKRPNSPIMMLFPLVIASLGVAPFSSLQYAILPLVLLGMMSLGSVGTNIMIVQRRASPKADGTGGKEVYDVDVDLVKLLSALTIIVLVLSSGFLGSIAFAGGLQQQRVESIVYGPSQIIPALDWVRSNTSRASASVIAAPDTFSKWVQTYTGRPTLLGPPACPSPSDTSSPEAQANDLLLNSNIELRNEYLRLRDGSPYWTTQTPMFSVSNGSSFADLIYTTDAYNRVGFTYANSTWIEAPYQPKNFSSGWLARNSTEASMTMTYATQSLAIQKTMSLSDGSNEALLTYTVSPLKQVQLNSMNLTLWIPSGERVGNLTRSGGSYQLVLNGQLVLISSDPFPSNASLSVVGGQDRVLLQYKISARTFSVSLSLGFPSVAKSAWSQHLYGATSDEIIKQYGVSYVVVLNHPFNVLRLSSDPRFTQAYRNPDLIVFKVKASP